MVMGPYSTLELPLTCHCFQLSYALDTETENFMMIFLISCEIPPERGCSYSGRMVMVMMLFGLNQNVQTNLLNLTFLHEFIL